MADFAVPGVRGAEVPGLVVLGVAEVPAADAAVPANVPAKGGLAPAEGTGSFQGREEEDLRGIHGVGARKQLLPANAAEPGPRAPTLIVNFHEN